MSQRLGAREWMASLANVPEKTLRRWFLALLAGVTLVRLAALSILPLDLSGDEAYYWEWGRHLDWGYYSKPPGIAWLMAFASWLGGGAVIGLRVWCVLFASSGLGLLYLLTRRFYGPAAAFLAVLILAATPAEAALNIILTIDAPLLFFWLAALYAAWLFVESKGTSRSRAALLLIALAAGDLSKQMMLLFPVLFLLFLALSKNSKPLLRKPLTWISLAGSLLALAPAVFWNARHGWVTFRHTLHHFNGGSTRLIEILWRPLQFLLWQMGLATPVIGLVLLVLIAVLPTFWKTLGDPERFLWLFSGPGLLAIWIMSLRQPINPNWPMVFYPAAIILLSGWALAAAPLSPVLRRWRNRIPAGIGIGWGCMAALYLLVTLFSFHWIRLGRLDVSARLRGWSRLAADVADTAHSLPAQGSRLWIAQGHRYVTSELAFYLPGQPAVFPFTEDSNAIETEYDFWPTPAGALGQDALIVVQGAPKDLSAELSGRFDSVEFLRELRYGEKGEGGDDFTIFLGRHLRRWPENAWQARR